MQDFKNPKTFAPGTLIFNIHISRLKMIAGLQVYIDFNTESKFSFSRSSFFSPLSGHSKRTKPLKTLRIAFISYFDNWSKGIWDACLMQGKNK